MVNHWLLITILGSPPQLSLELAQQFEQEEEFYRNDVGWNNGRDLIDSTDNFRARNPQSGRKRQIHCSKIGHQWLLQSGQLAGSNYIESLVLIFYYKNFCEMVKGEF